MARKRLKKDYERLYAQPLAMFPPTASSNGAEVILWPNGAPEIWIRESGPVGRLFRITAGTGPHGFGLTIALGPAGRCDIAGNAGPALDLKGYHVKDAMIEVELCQYNSDERSQAFRRWYAGEGPHPSEQPSESASSGSDNDNDGNTEGATR